VSVSEGDVVCKLKLSISLKILNGRWETNFRKSKVSAARFLFFEHIIMDSATMFRFWSAAMRGASCSGVKSMVQLGGMYMLSEAKVFTRSWRSSIGFPLSDDRVKVKSRSCGKSSKKVDRSSRSS